MVADGSFLLIFMAGKGKNSPGSPLKAISSTFDTHRNAD